MNGMKIKMKISAVTAVMIQAGMIPLVRGIQWRKLRTLVQRAA